MIHINGQTYATLMKHQNNLVVNIREYATNHSWKATSYEKMNYYDVIGRLAIVQEDMKKINYFSNGKGHDKFWNFNSHVLSQQ